MTKIENENCITWNYLVHVSVFFIVVFLTACDRTSTKAMQSSEGVAILLTADIQYCAGHSPLRDYQASLANLRKIVEAVPESRAVLWVDLGDLIEDSETVAAEEIDFTLLDGIMHSVPNVWIKHTAGNNDQRIARLLHKNCAWDELYYAFSMVELPRWYFIVLNTSDSGREDMTSEQLKWLEKKLEYAKTNELYVMIFSHVPLSKMGDDLEPLSRLLTGNPNIQGIICGHTHAGGHSMLFGIPQIELKAVLDNKQTPTYGVLKIYNDSWELKGYGNQESYTFSIP